MVDYLYGVNEGCPEGTEITVISQYFDGAEFEPSGNDVMVLFN